MFELKIRIFTDLGEDAIDAFREVVPEEGVEFSVEYWDEDPVRISDALPVFISSNRYLLEKAERLDYLIVGVGIRADRLCGAAGCRPSKNLVIASLMEKFAEI